MRWLLPRLGRFEAAHPDIPVRLASTIKTTDFAVDDTDVVIRFGRGNWPGLEARFLFALDLVPVCAPAIAAGPPPLREPGDLARATILHSETMPEVWRMWLTMAGRADVSAEGGRRFQDNAMTVEGAVAGLGVAMADRRFVEAELAAGRLVVPFDVPLHMQSGFYLAYPVARTLDPRIAAFRAWILAEAAAEAPPVTAPSPAA
jgi:LysR family glycine cleavage system transcriptional activator